MKGENTLYHKRARDILGKPFTFIVSRYLGVSIAIGILGTFIVAWLIGKIVKPYETDVVRSGVTQLKAVLLGKHRIHWWPVL